MNTNDGLFKLVLHEVGHALGLAHPFDGEYKLPNSLCKTAYTVMAYASREQDATLMIYDIQVLQYLHGPNLNYNIGNDMC